MNMPFSSGEPDSAARYSGARRLLSVILFVAGFVLFALWMFRPVWGADIYLFATDDNIGVARYWKDNLPQAFVGAWQDAVLVGLPTLRTINWTSTMLWLLPVEVYKDWLPAITCTLGSLFLALYLRRRGMGWAACAMGALTAFWIGTNFTLLYSGHTPKFGVLMFSSLFLLLYDLAMDRASVAWATLAGGAFGMMFLEQPDMGLFFAVILGPYALCACWTTYRVALTTALRLLLPLFSVALLLSVHPLLSGYRTFAEEVGQTRRQDPLQHWEFLTQWSWPPLESIDFLAPGFTGWRSHEPDGPYWGCMGRSAGWTPENNQGFRNFKLENHYLGAIPLGFLALALWMAVARRRSGETSSREVLVWGVLALIAFLLACGKFLPFYRPFSLLPAVSSIRNPNKLLQVLQLMMGILAAYGLDALLGRHRDHWFGDIGPRSRRSFMVFFAGLTGLFALIWIGGTVTRDARIERLVADGWGEHAGVIAATTLRALAHGTVMLLIFTAVAMFFLFLRKQASWRLCLAAAWILVALVAVDAKLLTRHYVYGADLTLLQDNPVADIVVRNQGNRRVVLPLQNGFYGMWLTELFPYHGIQSLNLTHARLDERYQRFLGAAHQFPLRWWQLGAGSFVMCPARLWAQIQADPVTKDVFELAYAFNVIPAGKRAVRAVVASDEQPGQHVLLIFKAALPRYLVIDSWQTVPDEEALQRLFQPDFNPGRTVLVAPGQDGVLPQVAAGQGPVGNVEVLDHRAGDVRLMVSAERSAILLISERYNRGWQATIGDKTVPVLRCNYLFQGVPVEPGSHEVHLRYAPPRQTLYAQALGLGVCLLAALSLGVRQRNDRCA